MHFFSKIPTFLFVFATFFAQNLEAQCPTGAATILWTQTDIDSFPIKYPGCKNIENLEINFKLQSPFPSDLTPLLGIETVLGNLNIFAHDMPNFHGLDSLRFVGGDLVIQTDAYNSKLEKLDGLDNLEKVNGKVTIIGKLVKLKNLQGLGKLTEIGNGFLLDNPLIESLEGLGSLRKVGGERMLIRAVNLQNLKGLSKLDTVEGILEIRYTEHLKNFEGLQSFRHGGIQIGDANALQNLKGLENWRSGTYLSVQLCPLFESLDGIENLEYLSGDPDTNAIGLVLRSLWLRGNASLVDLSALNHPVFLGTGIRISDNPKLSACSVRAICDYLLTPIGQLNTMEIYQNLPNCNSDAEVLSFCTSSADEFSKNADFKISPNPIPDGQPLQILLENGFFGKIKIEVLSLDGRILQVFEKEKTDENQVFEIENLPAKTSFFVRVSDEKRSAVRLVSKF